MSDAPISAHHAQPGHERPDLSAVPLFPLPNVVLFPRLVLPLHVFEERYKAMIADAIGPRTGTSGTGGSGTGGFGTGGSGTGGSGETRSGDQRLIAMALLKPGWEKTYYGRSPIEPVVCVGSILSHERLPDGKYNFLLQGHTRARIIREHARVDGRLYRTAQLEPLCKSDVMEIDLLDTRERLSALFSEDGGELARLSIARHARQVLSSPLPTETVVDWLAFNLFEDVSLKQRLLSECDPRQRAATALRELQKLSPLISASPDLN